MTNWILGEDFYKRYDHFGSMQILWEKKWRFPVCFLPLVIKSHTISNSVMAVHKKSLPVRRAIGRLFEQNA